MAIDNQTCAICNDTESSALNLITQPFQLNSLKSCGHRFCPSCLSRELSTRRSFLCPLCNSVVKKTTLSSKSLDTQYCDDDVTWRRRVVRVYNKTEEDFDSLRMFNDYLEEVEDIIFSIVNSEPSAHALIDQIKTMEATDKQSINIRQSRRAETEREVEERLLGERIASDQLRITNAVVDEGVKSLKKKMKQEKMEVLLGEKDKVSKELKKEYDEAQRVGFHNAIRQTQKTKDEVSNSRGIGGIGVLVGGVSVRVFIPAEGLKSKNVVQGMGRDEIRRRIISSGGVLPGSVGSHERDFAEAIGSLFV